MFTFVYVSKVNSVRGITFLSFVPKIKIINLEHNMKMLFLMLHYILWICVSITVVFSCILDSSFK